MTVLTLPALDGRIPLGFLAALGSIRILEGQDMEPPRLSWSPDDWTARLHSAYETVDDVVTRLRSVIDSIPADGVLPELPPDLPPRGAAPDRLRLTPEDLHRLADSYAPKPDPEVEAWLTSLVTDLSTDDRGRSDISLMVAPSGRQSMRTMLEKPLNLMRNDPNTVSEALLGWRRYSGVSGEYLDHRVLYDAGDSGNGKSDERGVPGATWLALMSYPLFRTTAIDGKPVTSGWHRRPRKPPTFIYPLWTKPLNCSAISALIEHPALARFTETDDLTPVRAFSVFAVRRAQRRPIPGRTFAGVLAPIR